tara:strand:- start:48 stop:434 length:387 start_codon:yes stop_codon:yes gene_type:complete
MAINQLFKIKPTYDLLIKLCFYFMIDLNNLEQKKSFTINELNDIKFDVHIKKIHDMLYPYYLECKSKIYLNNLNKKKIITLLRQILKVYDYKLISTNNYTKSKKYILYTIRKKEAQKKININGVLIFD